MLLYNFGLIIRLTNEGDIDVAEWIALIFAGSLIATLFWVSACIYHLYAETARSPCTWLTLVKSALPLLSTQTLLMGLWLFYDTSTSEDKVPFQRIARKVCLHLLTLYSVHYLWLQWKCHQYPFSFRLHFHSSFSLVLHGCWWWLALELGAMIRTMIPCKMHHYTIP